MNPGDTFLGGILGRDTHLHVVLSYPFHGRVVLTMIATHDEPHKNNTCILEPPIDHPFITRKSYVVYEQTEIRFISEIEDLQNKDKIKKYPPFPANILEQILNGAANPKSRMNDACRNRLIKQGLIPY